MRLLKTSFLLILTLTFSCAASNNLNYLVLEAANRLPKTGILTKKEQNGYYYLKLDDNYIKLLYPIVKQFYPEMQKPPYFRTKNSVGAHVSVIYEKESRNLTIEELGKEFDFTVTGLKFVETKKRNYYVLEIESPQLEELRVKYGLPKFLNGFKFHITVACTGKHRK